LFVLPDGLSIELTPLSFLVGKWEGSGVIAYKPEGQEGKAAEHEFFQTIEFADNGLGSLSYSSVVRLTGETNAALPNELGFWRISRPAETADHGPGLILGEGEPTIKSHEELDKLRTDDGFALSVSTLHPGGVAEFYAGFVKNARIHLASEQGIAFDGAKTYRHSTRMYGLVEGALLWVWDIALPDTDLKSHASARLERVQ
jgi:hypothetical protein